MKEINKDTEEDKIRKYVINDILKLYKMLLIKQNMIYKKIVINRESSFKLKWKNGKSFRIKINPSKAQ